jgi:predicted SAM-dependent methyltransferase
MYLSTRSSQLLTTAFPRTDDVIRLVKQSRTLSAAVYDLRSVRTRLVSKVVDRRKIEKYLAGTSVRKLQLGANDVELPGWLNTDIAPSSPKTVYLDATKTFLLPTNSFDYIFHEHVIEHISYREGCYMLNECFRVLKSGGVMRISTPNLGALVALFSGDLTQEQYDYMSFIKQTWIPDAATASPCFIMNNMFRKDWVHIFVYDEPTLRDSLERTGFSEIRRQRVGESEDVNLRGLESRSVETPTTPPGWTRANAYESLVMEARKL